MVETLCRGVKHRGVVATAWRADMGLADGRCDWLVGGTEGSLSSARRAGLMVSLDATRCTPSPGLPLQKWAGWGVVATIKAL